MLKPSVRRPHMPGYGTLPAEEGTGLLPWTWAEQRLRDARRYWLATTWPDGRAHVMPVWAMWDGEYLWFSSSNGSRKTRNLLERPRCVITTEQAAEPVVVEGMAERVADEPSLRAVLELENTKYGTDYGMEMLDPAKNTTFRIRPVWAFGLDEADFGGSPTRWQF